MCYMMPFLSPVQHLILSFNTHSSLGQVTTEVFLSTVWLAGSETPLPDCILHLLFNTSAYIHAFM